MGQGSHLLVAVILQMDKKKFIAQVVIAMMLYVLISLILERDFSSEILLRELGDGLGFALVYALVLWIWKRIKAGKEN